MTEVLVMTIVAAVPPTMAAMAALIVSVRNGRKSDEIHVLVNSNMTAVKLELVRANERIEGLEALLAASNKPAEDY